MCGTHWVGSKTRDNRRSRSEKKKKNFLKKKGRQPNEKLTRTLHVILCCAHIDTLSIETTAAVPLAGNKPGWAVNNNRPDTIYIIIHVYKYLEPQCTLSGYFSDITVRLLIDNSNNNNNNINIF